MDYVLYFLPTASRNEIRAAEEALATVARRISPLRAKQVQVSFETNAQRALTRLRHGAFDAFVVDSTCETGSPEESECLGMLRALFDEHELASAIGRERTWFVVNDGERGTALAFEAGRARLAGVIAGNHQRWEQVWERITATTARGRGGKIALCLAGGGTEGLFYELGVLRALERFLPEFPLTEVDIVCGISAGAMIAGLLANGIGPDNLYRGLRGEGDGRITPMRRSDLFDPDWGSLAQRAVELSWEVARGKRSPLSAMFRLPPAGIFAGSRLRKWLKKQFTKPGMVDDFDKLQRKLFIGATDQDTNEHVVFGAPGTPKVPIHRAIRASAALAPFYAPEKIDGRYYIDGGFTRTTNMRVAVQEGATLVILVDPLVPVLGSQPGHVAKRGAVFVAMQGLKSLINGRFDKAIPTLRAMYPHVNFHLFQPGEASRRVMGGSPMKYFFREEIVEIAYRETIRTLRSTRGTLLQRDFMRHGVQFRDPDALPENQSSLRVESTLQIVA